MGPPGPGLATHTPRAQHTPLSLLLQLQLRLLPLLTNICLISSSFLWSSLRNSFPLGLICFLEAVGGPERKRPGERITVGQGWPEPGAGILWTHGQEDATVPAASPHLAPKPGTDAGAGKSGCERRETGCHLKGWLSHHPVLEAHLLQFAAPVELIVPTVSARGGPPCSTGSTSPEASRSAVGSHSPLEVENAAGIRRGPRPSSTEDRVQDSGGCRGQPQREGRQQMVTGRTRDQGLSPRRPARAELSPTTLTLHRPKEMLPRFITSFVPHFHLLGAAHHGKGEVCWKGPKWMSTAQNTCAVDRPTLAAPGPQGGSLRNPNKAGATRECSSALL